MENPSLDSMPLSQKLLFDLQLALYLDLVAVLEHAGAVSYRQMAARVLNLSLLAQADGDQPLAQVLEGIAAGFASQDNGLSLGVLKAASGLRNEEAMGDIPSRPAGF